MLLNVSCPSCFKRFTDADVNVATDVAACKICGNVSKLSEVVANAAASPVDARFDGAAPAGAWFNQLSDGFEAGATTRSPIAFFLVPFMCVWTGGSIGGIYGTQVIKGKFDLFQSLFGIPFILGSIVFWTIALLAVAGKYTLTVHGDDAVTFVGVGRFGYRRKFAWSGVRSLTEETTQGGRGGARTSIFLLGDTRVQFATGVTQQRRYFLLNSLRRQLGRR